MASLLRNDMKAVREKGIGGFLRDLKEEGKPRSTAYLQRLLEFINSGINITRNWKILNLLLMLKPRRYGTEHKENFSGEGDKYIYHSKGHTLNPRLRDWIAHQPWQPTKT